jgi:hypothetical protein
MLITAFNNTVPLCPVTRHPLLISTLFLYNTFELRGKIAVCLHHLLATRVAKVASMTRGKALLPDDCIQNEAVQLLTTFRYVSWMLQKLGRCRTTLDIYLDDLNQVYRNSTNKSNTIRTGTH